MGVSFGGAATGMPALSHLMLGEGVNTGESSGSGKYDGGSVGTVEGLVGEIGSNLLGGDAIGTGKMVGGIPDMIGCLDGAGSCGSSFGGDVVDTGALGMDRGALLSGALF